jgi:hypothetical protein
VVYLDTKLEVCLEAIASRGTVQRGTKNVEAKVKMVQRTKERFDEAGVPTELLSRSAVTLR